MTLLLIGQAPARSATPLTRPWDSASGKRLASKMGTRHETLMALFETTNLNAELRGTKGKWDEFDEDEAKSIARQIHGRLRDYELVLCAGQRVAEIMGAPLLGWRCTKGGTYMTGIPHPGGTNFWWNHPTNRLLGERHCRTVWVLANHLRELSGDAVAPVRPLTQEPVGSGWLPHSIPAGTPGIDPMTRGLDAT